MGWSRGLDRLTRHDPTGTPQRQLVTKIGATSGLPASTPCRKRPADSSRQRDRRPRRSGPSHEVPGLNWDIPWVTLRPS